jgi:ABC-type transport system involved in multi-copper enzyme maturation permease subunit
MIPLVLLLSITSLGTAAPIVPGIVYQLVAACVCLLLTLRLLRRPMNPPKVELRKPLDDVKVLRERRTTWPYYLVDPLRRKKPIEDGRNPMRVREVRWGLINRGTTLIRLFYVAVTIYFFTAVMTSTSNVRDVGSLRVWFITQCVMTVIVAPALTANSITKELELGNLDMLRITLLRPREIVSGKFFAAVFTMLPMVLAALISLIPVAILVRPPWQVVAMGYGTLVVCALVALSVAIFFSTLLRRTLPAIVWSYVACAALFWGMTVGVFRYLLFTIGKEISDIQPLSSWFSPLSALSVGLDRYGDEGLGFWAPRTLAWLVVAVAFLGASWYLFARNRMRDA